MNTNFVLVLMIVLFRRSNTYSISCTYRQTALYSTFSNDEKVVNKVWSKPLVNSRFQRSRIPKNIDNNENTGNRFDRQDINKNRFPSSSTYSRDKPSFSSNNFREKFSGDSFRDDNRDRNSYSNFRDKNNRYTSSAYQPRDNENYDSNQNDRRYDIRYDSEEKREPVYGYYDGDHIYGISPVRLSLLAGKREIDELLIQSGMDLANKKDAKAAREILDTANRLNITTREFSKHDLNMITDNRPHQGFVLRAKPLQFKRLTYLEPSNTYSCVLALDEVWDPQNFGALLRTSYFLKCDKVIVCSKNSAPLSPAVSKASAGALEIMDVYSTDNLMKFLDKSRENGWQVVGTDLSEKSISLYDVPRTVPTILVLGNEGHGIRTNILRRCTHLIKIGNGNKDDDIDINTATTTTVTDLESSEEQISSISSSTSSTDEAVDSLNVSVTGAIILHHFLSSKSK